MTPQEYQSLLIETTETMLPLVPGPAAERLNQLLIDAITSDWEPTIASKLGVSLVIAYATYIDRSYPCSWKIEPKQGVINA